MQHALVATGGLVGSLRRYFGAGAVPQVADGDFSKGTLAVDVLGSSTDATRPRDPAT